jgi:opacity protein-like surface antigen
MRRIMAVATIVATLALASASDLFAQRKGFIIGFGIGPGVTSATQGGSKWSGWGLATDLKIGAQVSKSIQVYYLGRTNWFTPTDLVGAGISAFGVTYVLPTAPVHISGGLGLASWLPVCVSECDSTTESGFGLTGGVGWEFADLWLLDFGVTYGRPGGIDVFTARAGLSILSH